MRPFLIALLLLVFAADTVVFFRFRKWLGRLEHHRDEPLSAREERHAQSIIKLIGILSAAWTLLLLIVLFA